MQGRSDANAAVTQAAFDADALRLQVLQAQAVDKCLRRLQKATPAAAAAGAAGEAVLGAASVAWAVSVAFPPGKGYSM